MFWFVRLHFEQISLAFCTSVTQTVVTYWQNSFAFVIIMADQIEEPQNEEDVQIKVSKNHVINKVLLLLFK